MSAKIHFSFVLLLAVAATASCKHHAKSIVEPIAIEVVTVESKEIPYTKSFIAPISANYSATIQPRISGFLLASSFKNARNRTFEDVAGLISGWHVARSDQDDSLFHLKPVLQLFAFQLLLWKGILWFRNFACLQKNVVVLFSYSLSFKFQLVLLTFPPPCKDSSQHSSSSPSCDKVYIRAYLRQQSQENVFSESSNGIDFN